MSVRTVTGKLCCPVVRNVDKRELAAGIEIELEHTRDKRVARCIALAHLQELPDYYTRLWKMERTK